MVLTYFGSFHPFIHLAEVDLGAAGGTCQHTLPATRRQQITVGRSRRNTGFAHYAMTISERPLIPPFSVYNYLSEYISYSGKKLGQHIFKSIGSFQSSI